MLTSLTEPPAPSARRAILTAIVISLATPALATDEVRRCVEAAESAQSLRTVGRLREAADRFAACAAGPCPDVVRRDCARWGAEVTRDLPVVVLRVVDPEGRAVTHASVGIDGAAAVEISSETMPLDPGPHTLRVEAAGFPAEVVDVVTSRGEQGRVVLVRLRAPTSPSSAPVPASSQAQPRAATDRAGSTGVAPFLLYGVAALGLGGFTVLGLSAKKDADALRGSCAPQCPSADVDRIRTRARLADLSLILGLASAGVATWLLVTRPTPSSELAIGLGPTAAGARWLGAF